MGSAVIICNGKFPTKEYPLYLLRSADRIVCCDGAFATYLRHCESVFGDKRLPDAVVGDMDSIPKKLAKEYRDLMVTVSEQETNDMSKAFHYVLGHFPEISDVHFIAATGKREDHTVGNLSLLMEYAKELKQAERDISVDIVSDWCTAAAVTDSCEIAVGKGRAVSIFSPDNSLTIKSEGLEWPTDRVVFDNWWKATLNRASEDTVRLTFSHPSAALLILD